MKKHLYPSVEAMIAALKPSYPVSCIHPERLRAQARLFLDRFRGEVLYAVKCNPHPLVLQALYEGGIRHFDTASLPEIAQVCEMFADSVAYYHNPVKARASIQSAHHVYDIRCWVIDHVRELDKIEQETGGARHDILVRIATPSEHAVFELSSKFGVTPDQAPALLQEVVRRGHRAGIAFHVGSQCTATAAFTDAIALAGRVLRESAVRPAFFDIGGGFPAAYRSPAAPSIPAFLDAANAAVAALGLPEDCVTLCEPGRALAAPGCTLVVQVLLRKDSRLYLNDGIFGSMSELKYCGIETDMRGFRLKGPLSDQTADFTLYGPTCDSLDYLPKPFRLPADIDEGDWIEVDLLGAYSSSLATHFNGFHPDAYVEISGG